jgi:hypothetical protein
MKTQIVRGSLATGLFPVLPARTGKSSSINGRSPASRPDFKLLLTPIGTKCISARGPASCDNSALPASLNDWLASDAALVICRKDRGGAADAGSVRI